MSSSQKSGDGTSRFASLLQPLRDLADNWNIDIARELEQYIELLEGATFTVGDGGQRLNFAEGLYCPHTHTLLLLCSHVLSGVCPLSCTAAALVIQGSAFVYSKKVEYLYSLVFQALEYISAHKKRDAAAAAAAAASASSSGHDGDADDDMQPLDDAIESLCPQLFVFSHTCPICCTRSPLWVSAWF